MKIKVYLKQLRIKNLLTQEQVAKGLNMSQGNYSNWERGYKTPNVNSLKKIAEFYNISYEELGNAINK